MAKRKKIAIPDLYKMKRKGETITWLTAYTFPTAHYMEQAGIEMILVGDSASMTIYGNDSTLPITMDTCIGHCQAVRKAAPNVFVLGDMPFLSYHKSTEDAIYNAGRFLKEAGCDAIKLEGGVRIAEKVRAIVDAGISVCGHIGLTPQSSAMLGGFKVQGKTAESAKAMIEDALALQEAGAFAVLLECVPTPVTKIIHEKLSVLTFGIGAGPHCDGQLLIIHDIVGLYPIFQPKFVKQYANLGEEMQKAIEAYMKDCKEKVFPAKEHEFSISDEELEKIKQLEI
jgi:3-methyl-2-oxobutanoate hydroxymethyltransferase